METLFIGANVIFLPEVDSTNSYAIKLLKNVNPPEGTVVHAANQTHGRGQRGNVWNTLPGSNLTASVILKPSFLPMRKQFLLYQISALACYDVMAEILNDSQFDIKIKWPNDIMVGRKKIAGILIENFISAGRIEYSVIGIGINVLQGEFDSKLNATSLQILSGVHTDVNTVLKLLCRYLEKYYLMLKNGKDETISSEYLDRLFSYQDQELFEIKGEKIRLEVAGVSEDGLLILRDNTGAEKLYDVKDVKWLL